jgi:hypothetical protein
MLLSLIFMAKNALPIPPVEQNHPKKLYFQQEDIELEKDRLKNMAQQ